MKLAILLSLTAPLLALTKCGTNWPKNDPEPPIRPARAIIGGNIVTNSNKWPWQVGITTGCGVKIHNHRPIGSFVYGGHFFLKDYKAPANETVFMSKVIAIKTHPEYVGNGNWANDIQLLKLEKPIDFDDRLSPICLPNAEQSIPENGHAVATGFGYHDKTGEIDGHLREVLLPIINTSRCAHEWEKRSIVCTSTNKTLEGDSGGPLLMKASDGRWFQIGINSYGRRKTEKMIDDPNRREAYTDVRKYCDWIKEATDGEVTCEEEQVILQDAEL